MLTEEKADELIDKFTDTDLIKEFRKNNFRGIKYHALLMLSYKGIPSDIMRIIMKDLKKYIYVTPMKSLIQSDIYDYIRRKFKNTVTERKLALKDLLSPSLLKGYTMCIRSEGKTKKSPTVGFIFKVCVDILPG